MSHLDGGVLPGAGGVHGGRNGVGPSTPALAVSIVCSLPRALSGQAPASKVFPDGTSGCLERME